MIDEKIRIRENWEMSLATAKADGLEQGREEARLQRERSIRSMVSRGFEPSLIAEILNVSEEEVLRVLESD